MRRTGVADAKAIATGWTVCNVVPQFVAVLVLAVQIIAIESGLLGDIVLNQIVMREILHHHGMPQNRAKMIAGYPAVLCRVIAEHDTVAFAAAPQRGGVAHGAVL